MEESQGAIIDRFYAGLASGDLSDSLACLTPDARVWHCFDGLEQDRQECLAGWQAMIAGFPERAFINVRRHAIPGGFVQQHMMTGRTTGGDLVGWAICLVIRIEGGLIARIEEYIDRAGRFAVDDLQTAKTPGL